jgi:hypothetical protein
MLTKLELDQISGYLWLTRAFLASELSDPTLISLRKSLALEMTENAYRIALDLKHRLIPRL